MERLALRQQRLLYLGLVVLVSAWVASQFVVNANDNDIHQAAVRALLAGNNPYEHSSYIGPAHGVPLLIPWVMAGERVTAFLNLLFILILYGLTPQRINWMALGFVISPLLLFANASANITGISSGVGLILVLGRAKGWLRGYAWAMLALHPQEAGVILALDGLMAIRQRDWGALLAGGLLCLPSLIWLPAWLEALEEWNVVELHVARLSPAGRYPWWILALISGVILARLYQQRTWLRHYPEQLAWLANMLAWLWINPYIQLYTLWILLIPLRWLSGWVSLVLWAITFGIVYGFISDYQPERWIHGVVSLMVVWIGAGLWTIQPRAMIESPLSIER
jgi:hypothetical protein